MTRFCLTVHLIWGRVLGRHQATLGAAYANDAYLMGRIKPTLMALADTVSSFRQHADLEVCLGKCTIYMPGIPEERAHQLIRDCILGRASREYDEGRVKVGDLAPSPRPQDFLPLLQQHE